MTHPVGTVLTFGNGTIPSDWLECDGADVSQSTYAALYAVIGVSWGDPGGGNFTLPDFRSRVVVGAGTGAGLSARSVADTGGEEDHQLTEAELAAHRHSCTAGPQTVNNTVSSAHEMRELTLNRSTGFTGSDTAHENMQPFGVAKIGIRT